MMLHPGCGRLIAIFVLLLLVLPFVHAADDPPSQSLAETFDAYQPPGGLTGVMLK
jgi:hypothetical protein